MAPNDNSTTSSGNQTAPGDGRNLKSAGKALVQKYLTNCKSLYSCIYCRTHLANHDELVSRSFQGNHGRAYLFNSVINVACGPAVQRELNTGSHAVADIFCSNCEKTLGWKYEKAYVETQKYKEGKYIIELAHVVRENRHLELDRSEIFFGKGQRCSKRQPNSNVEDEDRLQKQLDLRSSSELDYLSSPSSSNGDKNHYTNNGAIDDDDNDIEELMFPFYDDLCLDKSSYSSSLSWSHLSRIRRSVYLDSTPYDWKYSAASPPSASGFDRKQAGKRSVNIVSSIGSSDISPSTSASPSSSSSSSNESSLGQIQRSSSGSYSDNGINDHRISARVDYDHTQFDFEPVDDYYALDGAPSISERHEEICDPDNNPHPANKFGAGEGKTSGNNSGDCCGSRSSLDNHNTDDHHHDNDDNIYDHGNDEDDNIAHSRNSHNNRSEISNPSSEHRGREQQKATAGSAFVDQQSTHSNSISLDDEEFYDCCTDHEISNASIVASDSSMTLKSAESLS